MIILLINHVSFVVFPGLACISVSVLNSRGGYIYIPCGKTTSVYVGELDYFEALTEVFLYTDEHQLGNKFIFSVRETCIIIKSESHCACSFVSGEAAKQHDVIS